MGADLGVPRVAVIAGQVTDDARGARGRAGVEVLALTDRVWQAGEAYSRAALLVEEAACGGRRPDQGRPRSAIAGHLAGRLDTAAPATTVEVPVVVGPGLYGDLPRVSLAARFGLGRFAGASSRLYVDQLLGFDLPCRAVASDGVRTAGWARRGRASECMRPPRRGGFVYSHLGEHPPKVPLNRRCYRRE